ncbi:mesenteric estrogen-dependent adipogenesis protein [Aplochiton taeniatus]
MTIDGVSRCKINFVEVEELLRNPPPGLTVETRGSGWLNVKSDEDNSLVLIDDFECSMGNVTFQQSLGRKIKVHNFWDYNRLRKSLTSKRIYVLVAACEEVSLIADKRSAKKPKVVKRFIVSIDGSDPYIRWKMERGLDWTISSVAGESYRVDIDFEDALRTCAGDSFRIIADGKMIRPAWTDTSFTLKYYSDALFDFPHWFGFSKRQFRIS